MSLYPDIASGERPGRTFDDMPLASHGLHAPDIRTRFVVCLGSAQYHKFREFRTNVVEATRAVRNYIHPSEICLITDTLQLASLTRLLSGALCGPGLRTMRSLSP